MEGAHKMHEELVAHCLRLAQIACSLEETRDLAEQLTRVLAYFQILDEVDTRGVKPAVHSLGLIGPLREDTPDIQPSVEELLANAPHVEGGFFQVPRVIE